MSALLIAIGVGFLMLGVSGLVTWLTYRARNSDGVADVRYETAGRWSYGVAAVGAILLVVGLFLS